MATTAVTIEKPESIRRAAGRVRRASKKKRLPSRNREAGAAGGALELFGGVMSVMLAPQLRRRSGDGSGAGTSLVPTPVTDVTRWCCWCWCS